MRIGVLAVQGAFIEHRHLLEKLHTETFELRQRADLEREMDGLILPGGESTVMGKLLTDLDMMSPIRDAIKAGMPVFGTCAGMILLAKDLRRATDRQVNLQTMDITVLRNAYGRQLGSFQTSGSFADMKEIPMTFIRAPYIEKIGPEVSVLAQVDGNIVAARQGKQLAVSFHPELGEDTRVHEYFLNDIVKRNQL